jgi:Sec-independent protein secretion pathway component TatC
MSTLVRQKLGPLRVVALLLFVLALIFAFLAVAPFLSPFVYPLF